MCAFLNLIKIRQELFTHVLKTIWSFFQLLQVLGVVDSRWRSSNFELPFLPLPFFFANYVEGWMRKSRLSKTKNRLLNQDVLFGLCYQFVSNVDCGWLLNVCYSKFSHCHSFLIELVKHAKIAIKFRKIQKQKNFALVARVSHVYVAIGGGGSFLRTKLWKSTWEDLRIWEM